MNITTTLRISTGNISLTDNNILEKLSHNSSYKQFSCFNDIDRLEYIVPIPKNNYKLYSNYLKELLQFFMDIETLGLSNNFINIIKYAIRENVDYININPDTDISDLFEKYDW